MRIALLGLVALAFAAAPAHAQAVQAPAAQPSSGSTFVVPSHRGEAVRVTTYERRPTQRGRLAERYRGLRADRSPRHQRIATGGRVAERTYSTPQHTFVRRGGSFFQVIPRR